MKSFELSSKVNKDGKRNFKIVLYKIFSDDCVDEVNEVGTEYNLNGITWIREYCEAALPSIEGMFLRCEFLDDDRTLICGHGETGEHPDGYPLLENATTIGVFTGGYIDEIETEHGKELVCIGEGTIDAQCYNNFCNKLDEELANGNNTMGSVEIMRKAPNEAIVYKYGYKALGRIPTEFVHSGYALLGIRPADSSAKIVELNEHKEDFVMNEAEIEKLVAKIVDSVAQADSKIATAVTDCDDKIAVAEQNAAKAVAEKDEALAKVAQVESELNACKSEQDELKSEIESKKSEIEAKETEIAELKEKLEKIQAEKKKDELNSALSKFSDVEKAYAQSEINAFNESPLTSDINTVINKIWEGVGRTSRNEPKGEANSYKEHEIEDIFTAINLPEGEDGIF